HGLVEEQAGGTHRAVAVGLDAVAPRFVGERFQIRAGAECVAFAGEDADARRGILFESAEGRRELLRGLAIDRVARLRAIDDHGGDEVILLDAHGHAAELTCLAARRRWRSSARCARARDRGCAGRRARTGCRAGPAEETRL